MGEFKKSTGWALIIRGLLFGIFGFLIVFMESKTIYSPVNYLGILLLVLGSLYVILSFLLRKVNKSWFWGFIWGIFDLFSGVYILFNESNATNLLTLIIGTFALIMGIGILITAFYVKGYRIFLYINSIVSLSFGLFIILNPVPGISGLSFLLGLYSFLLGVFLIYTGIILMRSKKKEEILKPEMKLNEKGD